MGVTFRILGTAGRDNAVWVRIDSGQATESLLFDCGDGCLSELSIGEIQAIDHLFLSHLHMDHIGGFDTFFRCTFNRDTKANRIWGPPDTTCIVQHRFQGFLWNLHAQMAGTWHVSDVHPQRIHTVRFELGEAFSVAHDEGERSYEGTVCEGTGYVVEALTMDHRTPVLAYVVREKTRHNIDTSRLASLGLRPGPWLQQLKQPAGRPATVEIDGVAHSVQALRTELITETPGNSIAYVTDFVLDEPAMERLCGDLRGCGTVICEGQYRHADAELAKRNFHMTTVLSATLARRADVGELILFHLSDRYDRSVWIEMLDEARQIFPNTHYPARWDLRPNT